MILEDILILLRHTVVGLTLGALITIPPLVEEDMTQGTQSI